MKPQLVVALCLVAILFGACSTSSYVAMKAEGEQAEVKLNDDAVMTGELLAIEDDALYLLKKSDKMMMRPGLDSTLMPSARIISIPLDNISKVTIQGFDDRGWIANVLIYQAVPTLLFTAAASTVDTDLTGGAFAIFAVPTLITALLFELSTPEAPTADIHSQPASLEDLKKFARYPQGLNDEQFNRFTSGETGMARFQIIND